MSEARAFTHRACAVENGRVVSAGPAPDLPPDTGRKSARLGR